MASITKINQNIKQHNNQSTIKQSSLKDQVVDTSKSDNQIHRRNSSITSIGSTFTPRTASSDSLAQLSNSIDHHTNKLELPNSPLTTIVNNLPSLTESQQVPIKRTLDLINLRSQSELSNSSQDDPTLLLAHSWTLFFSDTSSSKSTSRSHHHSHSQRDHTSLLKAAAYQSGMSQVFTDISDVQSLCTSLSAFKMIIAQAIRDGHLLPPSPHQFSSHQPNSRKAFGNKQPNTIPDSPDLSTLEDTLVIPGNGLGLVAMKPDHNLHFFRVGVNPVWEDPWNSKGGRLTIQTPLALLDPTFESIVLLIAGGVLETDAKKLMNSKNKDNEKMKEGGRVVGVVGSRRLTSSDRIEIWLSGPTIGSPPLDHWIQCIHTILIREISLPEVRLARYKKHL